MAGGLVFGATMLELGALSSVASLVRVETEWIGFIVHMAIAATVGAGLGLLVWHQRPGLGETIFWGVAYGTLWWFIGTLTLHPLFLGDGLGWDIERARASLPALLGHVSYGSTAGLAIALIGLARRRHWAAMQVGPGMLLRGGLAGLLAAWIIGGIMAAQGELASFVARTPADSRLVSWLITLLVGLLAGLGFATLYPRLSGGTGPRLIRGAMYGYVWWVAAPLSILPLLSGDGLPWGVEQVRESFPAFPGYILFGAFLALFYQWLGVTVRLLFSDAVIGGDEEGVGTEGLRALVRGLVSGLVGGLVFTGVMVQTGALMEVSNLIGASSPVTGFFVHLVIANLVGASYGLLFRRQSYDVGSALGWGATYGFIWWIVGPMTLMPVFLGATPVWSADVADTLFPNLIGHLAYGAGLGISFYLLEARYHPWWIPRTRSEEARIARRREQVLTSAPSLWTLVVVISLTLPVLLGTDATSITLPGN